MPRSPRGPFILQTQLSMQKPRLRKKVFLSITIIYAQMLKERKAALCRKRANFVLKETKGRMGYTKNQEDFLSRHPLNLTQQCRSVFSNTAARAFNVTNVKTLQGTFKSHQLACYGLESIAEIHKTVPPERLSRHSQH